MTLQIGNFGNLLETVKLEQILATYNAQYIARERALEHLHFQPVLVHRHPFTYTSVRPSTAEAVGRLHDGEEQNGRCQDLLPRR